MYRLPLAALLIAFLSAAHAADAVRVATARDFTIALPTGDKAAYRLQLHAYTFRSGRWQADAIASAVRDASGLLMQCGIAVTKASLTTLEAPPRLRNYSTDDARELARSITLERPALVFVDDTLNRPAYDAETIGIANAQHRPELVNTIWIAYGARDLPVTLAHELVHLLSNSGAHSEAPDNLMRDETSPAHTKLTAAQCSRMQRGGLAHGLLTRPTPTPDTNTRR